MNDWKDRELGMGRGITRRDFLNGVAVTAGAAMLPSDLLAAADMQAGPEQSSSYYPPALTGLRGSHPGSFDAAHSLRDGTFWERRERRWTLENRTIWWWWAEASADFPRRIFFARWRVKSAGPGSRQS